MRYGAAFFSSRSDRWSIYGFVILYALRCYIGPRYSNTPLYYTSTQHKDLGKIYEYSNQSVLSQNYISDGIDIYVNNEINYQPVTSNI